MHVSFVTPQANLLGVAQLHNWFARLLYTWSLSKRETMSAALQHFPGRPSWERSAIRRHSINTANQKFTVLLSFRRKLSILSVALRLPLTLTMPPWAKNLHRALKVLFKAKCYSGGACLQLLLDILKVYGLQKWTDRLIIRPCQNLSWILRVRSKSAWWSQKTWALPTHRLHNYCFTALCKPSSRSEMYTDWSKNQCRYRHVSMQSRAEQLNSNCQTADLHKNHCSA